MTGRPVVPLLFGGNMENEQKIANDGAQSEPGVVGQHDTVAAAHPVKGSASDGASESDSPQRPTRATRPRKDKGKLHARHHGCLAVSSRCLPARTDRVLLNFRQRHPRETGFRRAMSGAPRL